MLQIFFIKLLMPQRDWTMKDSFWKMAKIPKIPRIRAMAIVLCLAVLTAMAQSYPPAFPRKNAKEILQNNRVNVWDVLWPKNQPTAVHEHPFDLFSVTLRGGTVRATRPGRPPEKGEASTFGSVELTPKGTLHWEEGLSDIAQHKIMIELKPHPTADDVQGVLPAEGAAKVFENGRLVAWDLTWKPQETVSYHAEKFASVTVFLDGGTIRSVTGEGRPKDTVWRQGEVFYSADGIDEHTEQAVSGSPRAVIVELK